MHLMGYYPDSSVFQNGPDEQVLISGKAGFAGTG